MTNYHTSYRARKQRRINDICAKMRAGKERKRLEQDYAPDPGRPNLCMQVFVRDYECGDSRTTTYTLQACPIRRDSYWIWIGKTKLPKPMGKARFFRELSTNHPRLMPVE
jgi:hypothetical protein